MESVSSQLKFICRSGQMSYSSNFYYDRQDWNVIVVMWTLLFWWHLAKWRGAYLTAYKQSNLTWSAFVTIKDTRLFYWQTALFTTTWIMSSWPQLYWCIFNSTLCVFYYLCDCSEDLKMGKIWYPDKKVIIYSRGQGIREASNFLLAVDIKEKYACFLNYWRTFFYHDCMYL